MADFTATTLDWSALFSSSLINATRSLFYSTGPLFTFIPPIFQGNKKCRLRPVSTWQRPSAHVGPSLGRAESYALLPHRGSRLHKTLTASSTPRPIVATLGRYITATGRKRAPCSHSGRGRRRPFWTNDGRRMKWKVDEERKLEIWQKDGRCFVCPPRRVGQGLGSRCRFGVRRFRLGFLLSSDRRHRRP